MTKQTVNDEIPKDKRILKAAEKVFSHKGYTQATLDEIIQIADTGKGTVYKYFKNKENLFYTLVEEKNKRLVKVLQKAVEGETTFEGQFREYVYAFLHFLFRNGTLWSVILFELLNQQDGWRLLWNKEASDFVLDVRWGRRPTKQEIAVKRRYAELIGSEIHLLEEIFRRAMENGYIKLAMDYQDIMSQNFYFSIFMLFNQGAINKENMEEVVASMIDRFLYGHIKK
ncbi:TetR/AcrR family transcriptional regulator [Acidaminococcus sp.]|uniref:TetR/AcrR family transcriptional regulator n=1 Tax=Acidaminococcus sp. TaxID=1872103 RepID=UPI003D7E5EF7